MSPSSVPLDLAALRGLLAHGCFLSGLVSRSRGAFGAGSSLTPSSSDAPSRLQRALSSLKQEEGQERAAGGLRIFSPQTAVVYYTQEKNHKLKNANKRSRGAEEHCCRLCMSPSSLTPWLRGTWLLAPDPDQAVPTSARQGSFILLYFSFTCQDFVVFLWWFFF